jgi:hypothetical protein
VVVGGVVEAVGDVVVVVRNIVKVVGDVVVVVSRPLNFLVTAKICKGLDEQIGSYKFSLNQKYSVNSLSMSPSVLNLSYL